MASCIPEKKTERPLNPVLIARLDEQNVDEDRENVVECRYG